MRPLRNLPRLLRTVVLVLGVSSIALAAPRQNGGHPAPTELATGPRVVSIGDSVKLEAKLTSKTSGLGGKLVTFALVDGPVLGQTLTDPEGRASLATDIPPVGQKMWTLKASFAGDGSADASAGMASFSVMKGAPKLELEDMSWEKGEIPHGSISIKLRVGGKPLAKPVTISMNGMSWTVPPVAFPAIALQPLDAKTWKVHVAYDGDDSYLATSTDRTYTKP